MNDRRHGWLLPALALWAMWPVLVLVLRAATISWPFPLLFPSDVSGLANVSAGLGSGRLLRALTTSAGLAAATGGVSAVAGFAIARSAARASRGTRQFLTALALFAVVAPPIAVGTGLQVAMLGAGLSGTVAGVWLAHLVPAAGYLTLFAMGVFSAFDLSLEDESRTLGASMWQTAVHVTFPVLRLQLLEGALLGALVSWAQLATTILIGGGLVRTLPLELLSYVRSGEDQLGAAAALLLAVPPFLAIGVLRLGTRRSGVSL